MWSIESLELIKQIVKNEKGELIQDYDDITLTENSRVSYPLSYIKNYEPSGYGKIPKKIGIAPLKNA